MTCKPILAGHSPFLTSAQLIASKHLKDHSLPDWRQHAAAILSCCLPCSPATTVLPSCHNNKCSVFCQHIRAMNTCGCTYLQYSRLPKLSSKTVENEATYLCYYYVTSLIRCHQTVFLSLSQSSHSTDVCSSSFPMYYGVP